jgi:large repetitive protein
MSNSRKNDSRKPTRWSNWFQKRSQFKQALRRPTVEQLEDRRLMTVTPLPQTAAALSKILFNGQASYDQAVSWYNARFSSLSGSTGSEGSSDPEGQSHGALNIVEIEPNSSRLSAQYVNLGTNAGKSDIVNIAGSVLTIGEEDYFSFDLRKGDILDARLNLISVGTTGLIMSLADANGRELFVSTGNNNIPDPITNLSAVNSTSPRFIDGAANMTYVIDTTGRYSIRLGDQIGQYSLNLRAFRPRAESQPAGTQQVLLLDFDPGIFDARVIGDPAITNPIVRIPKLGTVLPQIGLTAADESRVIDEVTNRVRSKIDTQIGITGKNGYFPSTGNPGDFGLFVTNTKDNPQLRGQPNVTRVIIGGTQALYGIPVALGILGISQSLDVGNFDLAENVIVMLDQLLPSSNTVVKSGTSTTLEVFAELTAGVVAHEAGHSYGGIHQDPFNTVVGIMDQFYSPPIYAGVGLDGIFGTSDDTPLQFVDDEYSPAFGVIYGGGVSNTASVVAFGNSTSNQAAFVTGSVFNDRNRDGNRTSGDEGLADRLVFADYNNNGVLDVGEGRATSDSAGNYRLPVRPGTWPIRSVAPTNWTLTGAVSRTVTIGLGQTASNINFGQFLANQSVTGFKWSDTNGDGIRDPGEPGLSGFTIYVDLDGDNRIDIGEPAGKTNADGSYSISPPTSGTYAIREVLPPGYVQTYPSAALGGEHMVTFSSIPVRGIDFGNQPARDYGDAPSPYPTLASSNGANHGFDPKLRLGLNLDFEPNGLPDATASGDDNVGTLDTNLLVIDDEEGVVFARPIVKNDTNNLARVTVTNTTGGTAYVSGWVDFNRDGDWEDFGEKILSDVSVTTSGRNDYRFSAPAGVVAGPTFARFRLSPIQGIGSTGAADSGEVEDYLVSIFDSEKYAFDDTASVARNSTNNVIDVQANDYMRTVPGESASITSVSQGSSGGTVTHDGSLVRYTPRSGFTGIETFRYTVQTSTGKTDTATVTVTTTFRIVDPIAIDDSYDVTQNAIGIPLNVLANDIEGLTGALTIQSFEAPNQGGTIEMGQGRLSLRYTPRQGFGGTETFKYTVSDSSNKMSTANVTIHTIEGDRLDDRVELSLSFTSLDGSPITSIQQGRQFQVHVNVDDLRAPGTGAPSEPGVYAAYLDLLYNAGLVATTPSTNGSGFDFNVQFSSPYTTGQLGTAGTPGLISELGAFVGNTSGFNQPNSIRLASITFEAKSAGIAEFASDPANRSPRTDVVLFDTPSAPVPTSQVRYKRASIEIVPNSVEFPVAVDDAFVTPIGVNTFLNPINVLANDRPGNNPPVRIASVGTPLQGAAFIDDRGTSDPSDDFIAYSPRTAFQGTDEFTYTIRDARGFSSTANVTLQVGDATTDDIVQFRLETTNLSGTPIDQIGVGQRFQVRGYVKQLSSLNNAQIQGVYAAYQDILYDSTIVSISPLNFENVFGFRGVDADGNTIPPVAGREYPVAPSGDLVIPGLINELGSTNRETPTTINFPGTSERLQFIIEVTATGVGNATFKGDPADIKPFHDSLVFDPVLPLLNKQIRFISDTITIGNTIIAGEGFTNLGNRFDVNGDGSTSPIDALIIINSLNRGGSRELPRNTSGGEGEASSLMFVDVNGDGYLSPIDVLQVINALNRGATSGEGESGSVGTDIDDSLGNAIDLLADDIANQRRRSR